MTDTAESSGAAGREPGGASATSGADERRWPFRAAFAVLVVGLLVSGVLTWVSSSLYSHNETRLLELRGRELGAVLAQALPATQTPLASAAALADSTNGDPQKFKRFIVPYVGPPPRHQFVSVSLWRLRGSARKPTVVVGAPPALESSSTEIPALLNRAAASHKLTVTGILKSPALRLGYAFSTSGPTSPTGGYVAYGESMLPANRHSRLERNQAFSEINYAIYLGSALTNRNLLVTSLSRLPVQGRHSTLRVPFGDTVLTLVVAARQPLAGTLPERLPWIILIAGVVLALGAAGLTLRLSEGRRNAEQLATRLQQAVDENRRLYAEQRTIAQTLQHALLPAALPPVPGLRVSARYEAGAENVEIGGDWYDLITLGQGRVLLVVGDVSGRGLPAATMMAALRFAIHAYAVQGDDPEVFLPKLSRLMSVTEDRLLATILCVTINVASRELSVTSAGHLPPLIISEHGSEFVETPAGLPVGVDRDAAYKRTAVTAPPGATLLAFTDGLVERRGESIEVGLERLRAEVGSNHVPLEHLLTRVLTQLREDAFDDTAVAGIQWVS
jgi:serine phosphatase RsbU (regulator of sigma subunit)